MKKNINQQDLKEPLYLYHMNYLGHSLSNFNELFSPFNHLYAITFSYSLPFIKNTLENFDTAEIILGCNAIVKKDLQKIMAHQNRSIQETREFIKKNKNLIKMINNNKLTFFVTNDIVSHEKMYILTDDYGHSRIIIGSANFSTRAFDGSQGEIIACIDNSQLALKEFLNNFNTLKELSTSNIAKESLVIEDNVTDDEITLDSLPIIKEIKEHKNAIVIETNSNLDEIEYYTNIKNLSNNYKKFIPKNSTYQDEFGKIILTSKNIQKLLNNYVKLNTLEDIQKEQFPLFTINYNTNSVSLNDQKWNLNIDKEAIVSDINAFIKYFEGYDNFFGDKDKLKEKYYSMTNFMFISPFIATLRYKAYMYNYPERVFPIYGILNGKSNAGKSSFIKMILKLMFNKKMPIYNSDQYTKKSISTVLAQAKGCPILFDDIQKKRYETNSEEIIKYADQLPELGLKEHPIIIITSNDIDSLKPEYQKRSISFHFDQKLESMQAISATKYINDLIKSMTNSFYREYLRRMIPKVNEMIHKIENEEYENNCYPDIYQLSSQIILDIFDDYDIVKPKYIKKLTFEKDYFGDNIKSEHALQIILDAWKNNKNLFIIDRKHNKLKYITEHSYEAKKIVNELPISLEAQVFGKYVVMSLKNAEKIFNIKFHKSIFKQ